MTSANDSEERRQAVEDLLLIRRPLTEAITRLRQFGWDSEAELVLLTRRAATRVLDAYLAGQLDGSECQRWAEALEAREDVGYESGQEELLSRFLFELATPELFEALSPSVATAWRDRLDE